MAFDAILEAERQQPAKQQPNRDAKSGIGPEKFPGYVKFTHGFVKETISAPGSVPGKIFGGTKWAAKEIVKKKLKGGVCGTIGSIIATPVEDALGDKAKGLGAEIGDALCAVGTGPVGLTVYGTSKILQSSEVASQEHENKVIADSLEHDRWKKENPERAKLLDAVLNRQELKLKEPSSLMEETFRKEVNDLRAQELENIRTGIKLVGAGLGEDLGKPLLEDNKKQMSKGPVALAVPSFDDAISSIDAVRDGSNDSDPTQFIPLPKAALGALRRVENSKEAQEFLDKEIILGDSDSKKKSIIKEKIQLLSGIDEKDAEQFIDDLEANSESGIESLEQINEKLDQIVDPAKLEADRQIESEKTQALCNFLGYVGTLKHPALKQVALYGQCAVQMKTAISMIASNGMSCGAAGAIAGVVSALAPKNSLIGKMAGGAASGVALGPYGMAAGAALALFDHFFGGSDDGPAVDPTTLILEQIHKLSEQIADLRKAMEENFNENFRMQLQIISLIQEGFNDLTNHLDHRMDRISSQIGGFRVQVLDELRNIEATICAGFLANNLTAIQVLTQNLRNSTAEADQLMHNSLPMSEKTFRERLWKVNSKLSFWISESSNTELVGSSHGCLKPHARGMEIGLTNQTLEYIGRPDSEINDTRLNFLLGYLINNAVQYDPGFADPNKMAINPLLHFQALGSLIELRKHYANLFNKQDDLELDKIAAKSSEIFTLFNNKLFGYTCKLIPKQDAIIDECEIGIYKTESVIYCKIKDCEPLLVDDQALLEEVLKPKFEQPFAKFSEKDLIKILEFTSRKHYTADSSAQVLWESLIKEYYAILADIKEEIITFAKAASMTKKNVFDEKFRSGDRNEFQTPPGEFSFLDDPNILVEMFSGRSIQALHGKVNFIGVLDEKFTESRLGSEPSKLGIYTALKNNSDVDKSILAAEYLNLIRFNVVGQVSLEDAVRERWSGWSKKTDDAPGPSVYFLYVPKNKLRNLTLVNDANVLQFDTNFKTEPLTNQDNWELPLQLSITSVVDGGQLCLSKVVFNGAWTNLGQYSCKGYVHGHMKSWEVVRLQPLSTIDRLADYPVDHPTLVHFGETLVPNYSKHLAPTVLRVWGSGAVGLAPNQEIISSQKKDAIEKGIKAYFIQVRREILQKLIDNNATESPDEAKSAGRFYKLLDLLDLRVRLMQSYLHLIRPNSAGFSKKLLTKKKVLDGLKGYKSQTQTITIDESVFAFLTAKLTPLAPKKRLNYEDIQLAKSGKASVIHPLVLLQQSIANLKLLKVNRELAFKIFPSLMQYIDLQRYQQDLLLVKSTVFQNRVLLALDLIQKDRFTDAKLNLAKNCILQANNGIIAMEQYRDKHQTLYNWAVGYSLSSLDGKVSVGEYAKMLREFNNELLSSLAEKFYLVQQSTPKQLLGWESHVWLLQKIFLAYTKLPLGESKLPYFPIWYSGVKNLLKVYNNKKLEKAALLTVLPEEERNCEVSEEKKQVLWVARVNVLKDCSGVGKVLQKFIYQVGLSKEFFEAIFADYLGSFDLVKGWFILNQDQENGPKLSNERICAFIKNDFNAVTSTVNNGGNLVAGFKKIEASMLLLGSYVQMVFGYQLAMQPQFKRLCEFALTLDKFKRFLELEPGSECTLAGKINKYLEAIEALQMQVLYYVECSRGLLALRYYLENYDTLGKQNGATVLRIDAKIFGCAFPDDAIDLIDQFLSFNKQMVRIEIDGIPFDDKSLECLVEVISKHPNINCLSLINANLTSSMFKLIQPLMCQLRTLDVSHNCLGKRIDGVSNNNNIGEVLQYGSLFELNLTNNALTDDELEVVGRCLEVHDELQSLDLSSNPKLFSDEKIQYLGLILQQHKNLQVLSLKNTGLTANQLALHVRKNNLKDFQFEKMQRLDISDNEIFDNSTKGYVGFMNLLMPLKSLQQLVLTNSQKTNIDIPKHSGNLAMIFYLLPNLRSCILSKDVSDTLQKQLKKQPNEIKNRDAGVELIFAQVSIDEIKSSSLSEEKQLARNLRGELFMHLELGQPKLDHALRLIGQNMAFFEHKKSQVANSSCSETKGDAVLVMSSKI